MESAYSVRREKSLPKLHRAVWKGKLDKVKKLTVNIKTSQLNAADKEQRCMTAPSS